jgi:hypothetical protein
VCERTPRAEPGAEILTCSKPLRRLIDKRFLHFAPVSVGLLAGPEQDASQSLYRHLLRPPVKGLIPEVLKLPLMMHTREDHAGDTPGHAHHGMFFVVSVHPETPDFEGQHRPFSA